MGSNNDSTSNMLTMVNMYSATVLKILQQAVEEVKRGLVLLKQYQKNSITTANENSSNPATSPSGVSQKQKTQSSVLQLNSKLASSTTTKESKSKENSSSDSPTTSNEAVAQAPPVTTNFDMAHFDRTLVVIVHFLIVVAESLKHCSPEDTFKLKKLVYELIKLNPKNSKQSTLLHLASSRDSSNIIKNHTLSSFPSTEVLRLLLECGADPNSLDGERNSPLHLAASNRHSSLTSSPPIPAQPVAVPTNPMVCLDY
jgi:hypothetical protein